MFGIGTWELILILVLALLVLGPTKLPEAARLLGRNLAKLRQVADDVKRDINFDQIKSELEDVTARPLHSLTERPPEPPTVMDQKDPVRMPGPVPIERGQESTPCEEDKKE
jgi:sec-independent protein translocase protein TatB